MRKVKQNDFVTLFGSRCLPLGHQCIWYHGALQLPELLLI